MINIPIIKLRKKPNKKRFEELINIPSNKIYDEFNSKIDKNEERYNNVKRRLWRRLHAAIKKDNVTYDQYLKLISKMEGEGDK